MKNLNLKLTSAALAIAAIVFNAQTANAADTAFGHEISTVTQCDAGIVMSEFRDKTGFMVQGGGATILYNYANQTITTVTDTCIAEVYVGTTVATTAQANSAFAEVASNK